MCYVRTQIGSNSSTGGNTILAQADNRLFQDVIKKIYSDLSRYLLRHPTLIHKDVIILNLYSENVFDIETIFRKVESFPGVKNAEVVQPLDIRWPQDWLIKEIDQRLKKEEKFTADVV